MNLGRKPGSKNRPKQNGAATNGATRPETTKHDEAAAKSDMTDEQLHGLMDHHASKYEKALAAKKAADANLKNICKLAKAEGIEPVQIKEYLEAATEEGQAKIKARLEATVRIARWRGFEAALGTQFGMFEEGGDSNSFKAGKEAGLRGDPAKSPAKYDINEWLAGWQKGQGIILENVRLKKERGDAEWNAEWNAAGAQPNPSTPPQPEPDEF